MSDVGQETIQEAAVALPGGIKSRHKRFLWIIFGLVFFAAIVGLVLNALGSSITYFYSPTEVVQDKVPQGRAFRVGGMVEGGSVRRELDGLTVHFKVTDTAETVAVVYTGILPDLFAEEKGVVAQGKLDEDGVFQATQVLAKHDENYVAPEVQAALDEAHKARAAQTLEQ
ncbi:MAG: cytochrome c maturation protein CcmE [Burkholderiales bacterium]|jgi:cytochrome c-type biogenesis protein CcmE|nr:cytochrome c maturation protein CcmE [Burkholderiales bacterium]